MEEKNKEKNKVQKMSSANEQYSTNHAIKSISPPAMQLKSAKNETDFQDEEFVKGNMYSSDRPIQQKAASESTKNANQVVQRKKVKGTINKEATDPPYGWDYGYDFTIGRRTCAIHVKIKLNPDDDVTKSEIRKVKRHTKKAIKKYYNKKFSLKQKDKKAKKVKVSVSFVKDGEHLLVNLHKGEGHDDLSNWYTASPPIVRAHEFGHQLGFKDEYEDEDATEREVFTDNSLMGNFWNEGVKKAKVKKRNMDLVGEDIAESTGEDYSIK